MRKTKQSKIEKNKLRTLSSLKFGSKQSQNTTQLSLNSSEASEFIQSAYPKLYRSTHFHEYLVLYIHFVQFLDFLEQMNATTERLRETSRVHKTTLRQVYSKHEYSYTELLSKFKSYLRNNFPSFNEMYDLNATKTTKVVAKIIQNFQYACPVLKKKANSDDVYRVNSVLKETIHRECLKLEALIE